MTLVSKILAGECEVPLFVIGKNPETSKLATKVKLAGIVDDYAAKHSAWHGLPCISAQELPEKAVVINCSSSIAPLSAVARVKEVHADMTVLHYSDFVMAAPAEFEKPAFVKEMLSSIESSKTEWMWLRNLLHDNDSKLLLDRLIRFRSTGDCFLMKGMSVRLSDQYFEDFLPRGAGKVFVDCGGYDGDTTEEFCRRFPGYERVYMFEPSEMNLARAKMRLKNQRDITFLPVGVSDAPEELSFDPKLGSASSIVSQGAVRIQVTTIDEAISETVTFIKMDLEGWEVYALKGSLRHIMEDHPVLAIAVYHHADDFWKIARLVLGFRQDYHVHIRHYTEGWSETVMYFVPF